MSSLGERMADLFIPVDHPESSSSTLGTETSVNTATASATIQSVSTPPTTTSSKNSARDATPQCVNVTSPLSVRYTISGPAPEVQSQQAKPETSQTPRNERPNAVHVRRHSRRLSCPVSPIQELTKRLSRATGGEIPEPLLPPPPPPPRTPPLLSSDPIKRVADASEDESSLSAVAPTPFSSPEMTPVPIDIANLSNSRASPLSLVAKMPETPVRFHKPEVLPAHLPAPALQRALSQSSSRSDRSLPPAAFPPDFYAKSAISQRTSRQTRSRSNSAKNSSRSTSPLKYQISNHESGNTKFALFRQLSRNHESLSPTPVRRQTAPPSNYSSVPVDGDSMTFHTVIHQYMSCPHTCPPTTRPLNTQPTLDEEFDPPRSVLSGSCFECDTSGRRDLESSILYGYNPRITAHVAELSSILARLEALSPVSPLSPSALSEKLQDLTMGDIPPSEERTAPSHSGDDVQNSRRNSETSLVSEDSSDDLIAIRIQVLEDRINELTMSRDKEVKDVWKGYTQRWGPGTLGLLKNIDIDRASIGTPRTGLSSRMSTNSEYSQYGTGEGRMKVDWIRDRAD